MVQYYANYGYSLDRLCCERIMYLGEKRLTFVKKEGQKRGRREEEKEKVLL